METAKNKSIWRKSIKEIKCVRNNYRTTKKKTWKTQKNYYIVYGIGKVLNNYYLVFADTTNKKIYISKDIKKEIAIAILSFPIVVNCIGNSNVQMMASTFTIMKDDAYNIACEAGLNPRTPYEMPEFEYGFYHYHSIATALVKTKSGMFENRNPHSFFCL